MTIKLSAIWAGAITTSLLSFNVLADVTGDFTVVSATYLNSGNQYGGDVTIAGTVNNGAIQSKKTVAVDITYSVAYTYTMTNDQTQVTTIPGSCTSYDYYWAVNKNHKYIHKTACDATKDNTPASELWETTQTEIVTVTQAFDGTNGMTAITEPTISNGRLNPKGKITGYNWVSTKSLVPTDLVPELPAGAVLVSAVIADVSYKAYLKDTSGYEIPDTVITDSMEFHQ